MPRGAPRLRTPDNKQNLVGARVKARRQALNVTQDALCASLAKITLGRWNPSIFDVYRIETGRRIVSDIELLALSIALRTDIYDLLGTDRSALVLPG